MIQQERKRGTCLPAYEDFDMQNIVQGPLLLLVVISSLYKDQVARLQLLEPDLNWQRVEKIGLVPRPQLEPEQLLKVSNAAPDEPTAV